MEPTYNADVDTWREYAETLGVDTEGSRAEVRERCLTAPAKETSTPKAEAKQRRGSRSE